METDNLIDDDLPAFILELKTLIGLPAALKLCENFGGTHLRIPQAFDPDYILCRLLGAQSSLAMIQRYGGSHLYIAKVDAPLRIQRNIEIARRFDGGTPARRLALTFHLTERQIWKILKRPETVRQDSPQQPLF